MIRVLLTPNHQNTTHLDGAKTGFTQNYWDLDEADAYSVSLLREKRLYKIGLKLVNILNNTDDRKKSSGTWHGVLLLLLDY